MELPVCRSNGIYRLNALWLLLYFQIFLQSFRCPISISVFFIKQ